MEIVKETTVGEKRLERDNDITIIEIKKNLKGKDKDKIQGITLNTRVVQKGEVDNAIKTITKSLAEK